MTSAFVKRFAPWLIVVMLIVVAFGVAIVTFLTADTVAAPFFEGQVDSWPFRLGMMGWALVLLIVGVRKGGGTTLRACMGMLVLTNVAGLVQGHEGMMTPYQVAQLFFVAGIVTYLVFGRFGPKSDGSDRP